MSPWMLLKAWYRQYWFPSAVFVLLFSVALSLGVALLAQERAIKQSSAAVSDKFDLVIGAPGSKIDLILNTAFLQVGFLETLPTHVWYDLMMDERVQWFAPIVFGDGFKGAPIIGTSQHLANALYGVEDNFSDLHGAFVGSLVDLQVGDTFQPQHGMLETTEEDEESAHHHSVHYTVEKKLPATGTPWDNAILVPVEASWNVHGLGDGHDEHEHEHEHAEHDHDDEHEEAGMTLGQFTLNDPLKPVSAFVVKPTSIAKAYALRSEYSDAETQAVFPGEVMVTLYALMGDARALMSQITLICEALVMLSLLFGIATLFALFKREFAILRTIGASRAYLLTSVWCFVVSLMGAGLFLGMALATLEVGVISHLISHKAGFHISATLAQSDWLFAGTILAIGSLLALLPAVFVYRVSSNKLMRSI